MNLKIMQSTGRVPRTQCHRWRLAVVLAISTNVRIFAADLLQVQQTPFDGFTPWWYLLRQPLRRGPRLPDADRRQCRIERMLARGSRKATSSLPGSLIALENQADGMRALARRYRRRIAPAVRFQCLPDRPRVTRLPILGLRNEFVATRRDHLQAARRLPQQQPLTGHFLLAVGLIDRPGRHRVADFVVKQDAARGEHCRKRVIFDFPAMHLPADPGTHDLQLLAGDKPSPVEAMSAEG